MKPDDESPCRWRDLWAQEMDRWNRERTGGRGELNSKRFWEGFDLWEAYETYTGYPGRLMDSILKGVDRQTTVLDVGAGSGGLSVPLAAVGRQVTAVEPSSSQCARLRAKADTQGISNLRVLERSWEEVGKEELGPHDVVTAGYCLFMRDIVSALEKMIAIARKRVFLVHIAGHDLQGVMQELLGLTARVPDYKVLLHVLHEMGLRGSVKIFRREYTLPLNLQMDVFRYTRGLSDDQVAVLEHHLVTKRRIGVQDGVARLRREYRDALITVEGRAAG